MFRNNLTFKGICTIILFITMGVSQVSLRIENVDTGAGTLDIYMASVAGCSSCDDPLYNTKTLCESSGNNTAGGVWTFEAGLDAVTCTDAAKNGVYFDGKVKGFQFFLKGITIASVSGGTAEQYFGSPNGYFDFDVTGGIILGAAFVDAVIPEGSGVLTTIGFSDPGDEICFVESGSSCWDDYDNDSETPDTIEYNVDSCEKTWALNIISDIDGIEVNTNWNNCWCGDDQYLDDCGVCDGTSEIVDDGEIPDEGECCQEGSEQDCAGACGGTAADADEDGVCDETDTCADTPSDETADPTTGCSESQLSISQISTYMPDEFAIAQNFPNPFNPITSITFDVAEMDEVSLIVYDLTGKEVVTLVAGTYTPGTYNVEWNAVNNIGDGIVSGMYIYRYTSSEKAISRKMLYLK